MNKKMNSALFILGATVVNVIIMVGLFLLFLIIHLRFLAPLMGPDAAQLTLIGIFCAAIALTYFIYNWLMKLFASKVDMDKYFDPLVKPRKRN